MVEPELHFIAPTPYVPNSKLPVLIYRAVLQGFDRECILEHIQGNNWLKGGQWKTYRTAHFHSNTHECYAVLSGKSTYSLGKSPVDADFSEEGHENGKKLQVAQGDVFVLPAGVSHCSIDSEGDYEYIGFYPEGSPKWDMNYCKETPEQTRRKAVDCYNVPIPDTDPVYGASGPLPIIWQDADR
ncbi:hypothetical protein H2201_009002 [Coniosporium apollinis]|uniref:Cupin type-1 domain-containing protein n=2 Tax=Coniosporium TaxID=2810619 RepID=A0ABQ9NEX9_9PEZI|nr:hypothetical protein H2199_004652 [Cladosporium sp. JES 115]KAJ9654418.1 hypothetical protein H2201_009002 [Coniosporium apollinis]